MDYYKLSNFNPIIIEDLIQRFQSRGTISQGGISVFGDTVGRPGDNIYTLNSIQKYESESIAFEFKEMRIIVHKPFFVVSNEKVIGVKNASKVEWIKKDIHLIYDNKKNVLETFIKFGTHIFRTEENQDAFMFYAW